MKLIPKAVPILLATGWLSGTALAGTFTTTFADPFDPAVTLGGGNAQILTNTAVLTDNLANEAGSVTIVDFDGGQAIESFTATFKLQIGPGSGNPADGLSFNFGPDISAGSTYGEEGPGGTALSLCFDIYDNGFASEGVPTPSLDLKYRGVIIASHAYAKADMVTEKMEDVKVELKKSGYIKVTYKGAVVFDNVFIPGWTPTFGLFNWSARAGGESAEHAISAVSITTVLQGTTVAPTITTNPQNATADEGAAATFSTVVDGSAPFEIQWYKNNTPIPNATNVVLTLNAIPFTDNNAKIKVDVKNSASTVTSTEATLTVNRDTVAPTLVKANCDLAGTKVTVVFSEPVSDTALAASNYKINQSVTVNGVTRLSPTTVVLATSTLPQGLNFTLTVNGVQDMATSPANTIAANSQVSFRSYVFQVGSVLHKKYNTMADGDGPATLFADPRYNTNPDRQDLMPAWEYPINGGYRDATADPARNYMDTLEGYFIPPETADYVFFVDGADNVWLYLSTDSDPANKKMICNFGGWTNPRDWHVVQCGSSNGLRSDYFTGHEWLWGSSEGGAQITLNKGERYYLEAIHGDRSWSGADDFAVTYKLYTNADPAGGSAPSLTGAVVGTYLDPTGASITFNQPPANVAILQGRKATFTVQVTGTSVYGGNVTIQWQSAPAGSSTFTDIAGATTATYVTGNLDLAASGTQYRVKATVPGVTEFSPVATVTVNADTVPPVVTGAGAIASQTGATFDVGVTFDEPVDQTTAGNVANYSLSAGTISGIKFYAKSPGVVLTVSGLTAGNTYEVTVQNVKDVFGNAITTAKKSLTISPMKWGVVGADELGLGSGVIAVGNNGFDIYSDSVTEWASYDEATFVYEQITGDFDKEVRVEYNEPSSQWARAGLIVRDVTNFGVDRNAQTTNSLAGRYQKIHVQPVTTAMGTPGANDYEGNRRLVTGGATDGPLTGANTNPKYPNAWCRLQRVGETFNILRSDDGVNWVLLGSTTFDPVMPATVYVGPEFAPENGNIDAGLRGVFVAKFRDYRTHSAVVIPPTMTYQRTPTGLTITFEGTLQSADTVTGTWSDVSSTSPYTATVPAGAGLKFYRAKR